MTIRTLAAFILDGLGHRWDCPCGQRCRTGGAWARHVAAVHGGRLGGGP